MVVDGPDDDEALRVELRRRAMDLLARREHSRLELAHKLGQRVDEAAAGLIGPVLDQLETDGLLSDERFVESYVRMRRERGFGPLHIQQQLRERGIDDALAEAWLQEDDPEWQEVLREVIEKKTGSRQPPRPGSREHQKLQRFLHGRGFTAAQIQPLFRDT